MLYDALLTTELPTTVGPPLPTPFWDGLPRLLFSGSWTRRAATCTLSSASVLAGSYGALRTAASSPVFEIVDDAGELLDLSAIPEKWGEAPLPWAELLPPRWTTEPCAFRLRATWQEGGFAAVALLRHTPRHAVEQTALSGAVRVAWLPEASGERLDARLAERTVGGRLAALLQRHGDRVVEALTDALGAHFDAASSTRSRVVVLADPVAGEGAGFGDLLAGLPEQAVAALPRVRDTLVGTWPALAGDGVEGRWTRGRFVSVAEVHHAV